MNAKRRAGLDGMNRIHRIGEWVYPVDPVNPVGILEKPAFK